MRYLSNTEFRNNYIYMGIVFLITVLLMRGCIYCYTQEINEIFYTQCTATVGKIVDEYPELEDELIEILNIQPTSQHIETGKRVLRQYGYTVNLSFRELKCINDIFKKVLWILYIIVSLVFVSIALVNFGGFYRIYRTISELSRVVDEILECKGQMLLKEESGDLGVLRHQISQLSMCLCEHIEKLQKEKVFLKDLISDISHQIKTPISTLIITNEIMINDQEISDEDQKYFLENNKKQLEHIEWLIKNLLKIATLDAGFISFKRDKVYMKALIENSVEQIQYLAESKAINLTIKENILDTYFIGDNNWTMEALINIIKNSIEHIPIGGQVDIEIEQGNFITQVSISDNGEGIKKEDILNIFNRFYKCKGHCKIDSTGIGLSLAKKIIESQDGDIYVVSEEGKGTKFIISFINN